MPGLFDRYLWLLTERAARTGPGAGAAILEGCRESFILDWSLDGAERRGPNGLTGSPELETANELN